MEDKAWNFLLRRIENGECTPVLGPGIDASFQPPRSHIALTWAQEHGYPLADTEDMARVAQYLSVEEYDLFPKDEMKRLLEQDAPPAGAAPEEPFAILAALDLPIYITTGYYDSMVRALQAAKKDAVWELCRWNQFLRARDSLLEGGLQPTAAAPLVFHMLGHYEHPESMVMTEDDYVDFLVNVTGSRYPLPARIRQALSESSLLFIGFSPADWDFRLLFRALVTATRSELRRMSVTVQVPPLSEEMAPAARAKVEHYLDAYIRKIDADMQIYWGSATDFLQELQRRRAGKEVAAPEPGEPDEQIDQVSLYRRLKEYFGKEDLLDIAFELQIDADNLPPVKNSFARALILELQRRKQLATLVEVCRRERPNVAW